MNKCSDYFKHIWEIAAPVKKYLLKDRECNFEMFTRFISHATLTTFLLIVGYMKAARFRPDFLSP